MNTSTFAKTIVSHWSVIAVVAVLIYYSIFSHEFQLYWDDQWQVIKFDDERRDIIEEFADYIPQY